MRTGRPKATLVDREEVLRRLEEMVAARKGKNEAPQ